MDRPTGALPHQLKIEREPAAAKCNRTRTVTTADGSPPYLPGSTITVKPTVGTVSTVFDSTTSYFMVDLEIVNNNCFVDYCNFAQCGAGHSILNTLTIVNQSVSLETLNYYNLLSNLLSIQKGATDQVCSYYFSNKLSLGADQASHLNFIKPPMVDRQGQIMFGMNQFGLGFNSLGQIQSAYTNRYLTGMEAAGSSALTTQVTGGIMQTFQNYRESTLYQVVSDTSNGTLVIGDFAGTFPFTSGSRSCAPSWNIPAAWASANIVSNPSGITPLDWPDFYSPDENVIEALYVREFGSVNKPMITENLCNVRCFPIGMKPAYSAYTTQAYGTPDAALPSASTPTLATSSLPVNGGVAVSTRIRLVFRPHGGIIGDFQDHWLYGMLLTNGQFSIQGKLEDAKVALWLSSDPTRRLQGTCRSFIKNTGTANGRPYGSTTYTWATGGAANRSLFGYATSNYAPGYLPPHSVPLGVTASATATTDSNEEAAPNSVFNAAACTGRAKIQVATITNNVDPAVDTMAVNENYLNCSTCATPQYLLVLRPWLYPAITTPGAYRQFPCRVQDAFYGTYLEASVPQSRGIFSLNPQGGTSGVSEENRAALTTYKVWGFSFVADTISFPDSVADSIVTAAENERFVVDSVTYKVNTITVAQSSDQTLNLNVTALEARKMYIAFRNQRQYSNYEAYLYNSFSFLNPFASIYSQGSVAQITSGCYWDPTNFSGTSDAAFNSTLPNPTYGSPLVGIGYDTPPKYTPTSADPTSTQNVSFQLQVGVTSIPPSPLTTMIEILAETLKCREQFDNVWYSPNLWAQQQLATLVTGNTTQTYSGPGSYYECLQPDTYVTAFVPYTLWDDQRYTENYDMAPLYSFTTNTGAFNAAGSAGVLSSCGPAHANSYYGATGGTSGINTATINGYNWIEPRGFLCKKMFMHPGGCFHIGINFAAINMDSGLNSFTYLGTQNITATLKGAVGLNIAGENVEGYAFTMVNMRYKYGINGTMSAVTG